MTGTLKRGKLTAPVVARLRRQWAAMAGDTLLHRARRGEWLRREAAALGVSTAGIRSALNGRTWKMAG